MSAVDDAMKLFPVMEFKYERDEKEAMSACSFGIIGSSKCGKTTFLKYLLKKVFDDDIKVFQTQSPQASIYDNIKKESVFCPAFIPDIIKECYMINRETKNHYKFCIIIDDVADIKAKNHAQMSKLLCLYRNANMSAVVCGQDFTLLNANGRANVNNICLFHQNTDNRIEDNIRIFLRSYFPRKLSIEEKIELYKRLTADHHFLFINNLEGTIQRCKLKASQLLD
jgi:GTPase SAR1 family protein